MNLEPPEATFTQGLSIRELEKATREIIADVIEMGRDGIGAPTEVQIVGQIDRVTKELRKLLKHDYRQPRKI